MSITITVGVDPHLARLGASDSATMLRALAFFRDRANVDPLTPKHFHHWASPDGYVPSQASWCALVSKDLLVWRDFFGWVPNEAGLALLERAGV